MLDSNFWKKYFKVYDVLNLLIPYQKLLESVCNELEIKKGDKILEAGCGTGNLALKIKQRGGDVIGLDYCKEALDIYKGKDKNAKVILADLTEKLPFSDNSFDKIACNNVLYAIPGEKQLALLKEFYRILKRGGKLVISNPRKGAQPFKIYQSHIKDSLKVRGLIATFYSIIKMSIPTLKMFRFNRWILKEKKKFFLSSREQQRALKIAGFSVIKTELVYAKQGILTFAIER